MANGIDFFSISIYGVRAKKSGNGTRATVPIKVSPTAFLLSVVSNYGKGLRFILNWLRENKPKKLLKVKDTHKGNY
ncbi:hypothetical protein [Metallosphaera tengchongensis]|uniref:hypothetical protein n=1 Tax=Metallosphaera tengchongensis TaxID=1532350 RepID=UPI001FECE34C|nr:hypothetical protein [Metallosphaera tengchongensis]